MLRVDEELHHLRVQDGPALAEVRPHVVPTPQVRLVPVLPRDAVVELARLDHPRAPLQALDELEGTLDPLLRTRPRVGSGWKRREKRERGRGQCPEVNFSRSVRLVDVTSKIMIDFFNRT